MDVNGDEDGDAVDDLNNIRREMRELVDLLDNNVQLLLDRAGNLDSMETCADRLEAKAREFQVITKKMKYKHAVLRHKWALCVGLLVFVLVGIWAGTLTFWLCLRYE